MVGFTLIPLNFWYLVTLDPPIMWSLPTCVEVKLGLWQNQTYLSRLWLHTTTHSIFLRCKVTRKQVGRYRWTGVKWDELCRTYKLHVFPNGCLVSVEGVPRLRMIMDEDVQNNIQTRRQLVRRGTTYNGFDINATKVYQLIFLSIFLGKRLQNQNLQIKFMLLI